jgi:hypothetical protein
VSGVLAAIALIGAPAASAYGNTQRAAAPVTAPAQAPITEQDVIAAQNAWGNALVNISTTFERDGLAAARRVAENVIDSAYGFNMGPVLFKPTLTVAPQTFRTTREGALAYFVGGDTRFAADTGFALKGWRSFEIQNAAIFIDGDTAISMGNVRLTNRDGTVTTVDKTWGWNRDDNGQLRIVLHHSSLPFTAG